MTRETSTTKPAKRHSQIILLEDRKAGKDQQLKSYALNFILEVCVQQLLFNRAQVMPTSVLMHAERRKLVSEVMMPGWSRLFSTGDGSPTTLFDVA